jgi:hypothetical protein
METFSSQCVFVGERDRERNWERGRGRERERVQKK